MRCRVQNGSRMPRTMLRNRTIRIISISHAQSRVDQLARCRVLPCSIGARSGSAAGRDAGTGTGKGEVPGNSSAISPLLYAAGENEGYEAGTPARARFSSHGRTTLLCAEEVTLKNQADREVYGNDRIGHHRIYREPAGVCQP